MKDYFLLIVMGLMSECIFDDVLTDNMSKMKNYVSILILILG